MAQEGGHVVGAGRQGEGFVGADAPAVAPVVGGDDLPAVGELGVEEPEVDVGGGSPAVQEDDGRTAAPNQADADGAPAGYGNALTGARDLRTVRAVSGGQLSETGR